MIEKERRNEREKDVGEKKKDKMSVNNCHLQLEHVTSYDNYANLQEFLIRVFLAIFQLGSSLYDCHNGQASFEP